MRIASAFRMTAFVLWGATAIGLGLGAGGCGSGGSSKGCDPVAQTGCDAGLTCAETTDGKDACFAPLLVRGMVTDLTTGGAVAGARVVALDANGSPASTVATTDSVGNYELNVDAVRNSDGTPAGNITLRADAAGYQTFPGGVRQALPIDVSHPTESALVLVVQSSLTNVGLLPLEAGAGTGAIHGKVEVPKDQAGVLVVAELGPTQGFSAIADRNGDYKIFNLSAGSYSVNGYAHGSNYDAGAATLAAGEDKEVDLSLNSQATASLSGNVQIVNPGAGNATSVILVVESTFNEALVRGENPPGLRAPDGGIAPDITGAFTITGIPSGRYVVLAAFEDDFLVRDPDTCIAGTSILHQAFASGDTVDLTDGFKITGSLDVIAPGASGPEAVSSATPTFTWKDDSSEDHYHLIVLDSFGNTVWDTVIPGSSGSNPVVAYNADGTGAGTGAALQSGQFYQFRVVSTKTTGGGGGSTCELSQTEDLKGVFSVP